jgi:GT2 family glycosyltransferase
MELMIIDNASQDGSREWLEKNRFGLKIIANKNNLGFAKAHNMGIRLTNGEYYLPLNPDAFLEPNYVSEMISVLEKEKEVGSASGKVYFADNVGKPTSRIYTTGHLLTKNRKPANRGYKQKDIGQYEKKEYIFGVNGSCPIYRREMLEDVAVDGEYFDETFFLYGDDYDLGWRAQLLGWKSIYVPKAIAYHIGKGTGGFDTPYIRFQYARNRYLEIYKNDIFNHFIRDLPYIISYELLWQGYALLKSPGSMIDHMKALFNFVEMVPETRRKRKLIQSRIKVSPHYIRSLFSKFTLR